MADTVLVESPTDKKLEQRIAILRRLRETLSAQREKFRRYLVLLQKEEEIIHNGNLDKLESQVEVEQTIIAEIFKLQKVIRPLDELYRRAYPVREKSISHLESSLANIKKQVLAKNEKNRLLLKEKMALLRQEIKELRSGYSMKSPYREIGTPTLVDIST
jgi:hypothetical protein